MSIIIGIDPGAKGGIALLGASEPVRIPMPCVGKEINWQTVGAILEVWQAAGCKPTEIRAYVEKAHAMPKQGVTSMFKFGMAYGGILALLEHIEIETHIVTPQAWKKAVLAGTAKDKAAAIAYCHRRWPKLNLLATPKPRVPHNGMADALCIAAYGEMQGR